MLPLKLSWTLAARKFQEIAIDRKILIDLGATKLNHGVLHASLSLVRTFLGTGLKEGLQQKNMPIDKKH